MQNEREACAESATPRAEIMTGKGHNSHCYSLKYLLKICNFLIAFLIDLN